MLNFVQVFELVNVLFGQQSNQVRASMRVYKVVPLTQQSGLVEWCEDTIPIGTYLAGNPEQVRTHTKLLSLVTAFAVGFLLGLASRMT